MPVTLSQLHDLMDAHTSGREVGVAFSVKFLLKQIVEQVRRAQAAALALSFPPLYPRSTPRWSSMFRPSASISSPRRLRLADSSRMANRLSFRLVDLNELAIEALFGWRLRQSVRPESTLLSFEGNED